MNNPEIQFTPLNGSSLYGGGYSSLIEIDDAKIVMDCGSCISLLSPRMHLLDAQARAKVESELESFLAGFEATSDQVGAILLSHGDFAHVGALPLIAKRMGRPMRIICTQPVLKMGQMVLYDACINLNRY